MNVIHAFYERGYTHQTCVACAGSGRMLVLNPSPPSGPPPHTDFFHQSEGQKRHRLNPVPGCVCKGCAAHARERALQPVGIASVGPPGPLGSARATVREAPSGGAGAGGTRGGAVAKRCPCCGEEIKRAAREPLEADAELVAAVSELPEVKALRTLYEQRERVRLASRIVEAVLAEVRVSPTLIRMIVRVSPTQIRVIELEDIPFESVMAGVAGFDDVEEHEAKALVCDRAVASARVLELLEEPER